MKLIIYGCFGLLISLLCPSSEAQSKKVSFSDVAAIVDGVTIKGNGVSFNFVPGKTTEYYKLFASDTLEIEAAYRLNKTNAKEGESKGNTIEMLVNYKCTYKGKHKELKAERMYFLNEKLQFDESTTFNFNENTADNMQVKITCKGTIYEN